MYTTKTCNSLQHYACAMKSLPTANGSLNGALLRCQFHTKSMISKTLQVHFELSNTCYHALTQTNTSPVQTLHLKENVIARMTWERHCFAKNDMISPSIGVQAQNGAILVIIHTTSLGAPASWRHTCRANL